MNTIFVGLMTLMPAIVSLVVVIGVPVVLAALLLPEIRFHTRPARAAPGRPVRAGYLREVYEPTPHPNPSLLCPHEIRRLVAASRAATL
jgi:hypothetical protein